MPIALWPQPRASMYIGVEIGRISIADGRNMYGDGAGKTAVIGWRGMEWRVYERYDLPDRSGTHGDAARTRGQFSITSLGYRLAVARGPWALRALAGAAWLRRPSLASDPDELFTGYRVRAQHGLAAMLGLGLQLGPFTVEARAYPTSWTSLEGNTRYAYVDGMLAAETVTSETSPGGVPVSLTAGLGFGW